MDGAALSEDLLEEILVRLPYKSLARFQCVSTSWQCLISSDYVRRRLPLIASGVLFHEKPRGDKKQAYTYACASGGGIGDADMSFFPCHETSAIIDGCNGLLLYYASAPTAFHVVNPTTRRWAALPPPRRKTLLSVLAFDPGSSQHYKVVCFTRWLARGAGIEVFDSETGAWREHEIRFGVDTDAMSATMHYFGGALHVLAYSGHVVRIDLKTLACAVTALPAPVSCRARAGHCRGRLRYACHDGGRLKIWELTDSEKGEWVLKHTVSNASCQARLLAFHPESEVVYLWVPWNLVVFDLEKKRVEKEWALGPETQGAHLIQIWLFPFSRHLAGCLA